MESWFSSGQINFLGTHLDGQVEEILKLQDKTVW